MYVLLEISGRQHLFCNEESECLRYTWLNVSIIFGHHGFITIWGPQSHALDLSFECEVNNVNKDVSDILMYKG